MTEEEAHYFNESVPYDRGFTDGVSGNKFDEQRHPGDRFYQTGFEMGRKHLRDAYQRSLMNDYGKVGETA